MSLEEDHRARTRRARTGHQSVEPARDRVERASCCASTEHKPKNVFVATKTSANGPSGRSVAMSPTVATHALAAGLRAQALDHRGRRVDTVHLEPSLGERDGELARADPELEDRPTAAHRVEELDGCFAFGVHRVPLVVDVRDRVAVALWSDTPPPRPFWRRVMMGCGPPRADDPDRAHRRGRPSVQGAPAHDDRDRRVLHGTRRHRRRASCSEECSAACRSATSLNDPSTADAASRSDSGTAAALAGPPPSVDPPPVHRSRVCARGRRASARARDRRGRGAATIGTASGGRCSRRGRSSTSLSSRERSSRSGRSW